MIAWTKEEYNAIAKVDELQIASLRKDGTLRERVTIWVVGCFSHSVFELLIYKCV